MGDLLNRGIRRILVDGRERLRQAGRSPTANTVPVIKSVPDRTTGRSAPQMARSNEIRADYTTSGGNSARNCPSQDQGLQNPSVPGSSAQTKESSHDSELRANLVEVHVASPALSNPSKGQSGKRSLSPKLPATANQFSVLAEETEEIAGESNDPQEPEKRNSESPSFSQGSASSNPTGNPSTSAPLSHRDGAQIPEGEQAGRSKDVERNTSIIQGSISDSQSAEVHKVDDLDTLDPHALAMIALPTADPDIHHSSLDLSQLGDWAEVTDSDMVDAAARGVKGRFLADTEHTPDRGNVAKRRAKTSAAQGEGRSSNPQPPSGTQPYNVVSDHRIREGSGVPRPDPDPGKIPDTTNSGDRTSRILNELEDWALGPTIYIQHLGETAGAVPGPILPTPQAYETPLVNFSSYELPRG
ncbi:hypothetical protein R1sor_001976 [Riccia sorocarpa]|uniref:Uncharacterized protein n=1 Tax=Riccia sorocarpa TaxID=122646 RepID=A0ABD3H059_9MARC